MMRVLYDFGGERGRGSSALATVWRLCRRVRRVLQPTAPAYGGESIPRSALQRQRAEVHASHAWAPQRSGQLSGPATFHYRLAVADVDGVGAPAAADPDPRRYAGPRRYQL